MGIDAKEMLSWAWDENEAAGERLGDDAEEDDKAAADALKRRNKRKSKKKIKVEPNEDAIDAIDADIAAVEKQCLEKFRQELLDLGSSEAQKDGQRIIPDLAQRIGEMYLPAIGAGKVFAAMAALFNSPEIPRSHKLNVG